MPILRPRNRTRKAHWTLIPTTTMTPPPILKDLPDHVRTFYLMHHLITTSPICPPHQAEIWAAYIEQFTPHEFGALARFCSPFFPGRDDSKLSSSSSSSSSAKSQYEESWAFMQPDRWAEALAANWPLDGADAATPESVEALVEVDMWSGMLKGCEECAELAEWCLVNGGKSTRNVSVESEGVEVVEAEAEVEAENRPESSSGLRVVGSLLKEFGMAVLRNKSDTFSCGFGV